MLLIVFMFIEYLWHMVLLVPGHMCGHLLMHYETACIGNRGPSMNLMAQVFQTLCHHLYETTTSCILKLITIQLILSMQIILHGMERDVQVLTGAASTTSLHDSAGLQSWLMILKWGFAMVLLPLMKIDASVIL